MKSVAFCEGGIVLICAALRILSDTGVVITDVLVSDHLSLSPFILSEWLFRAQQPKDRSKAKMWSKTLRFGKSDELPRNRRVS